ncbi:unnamed protein product [Rotaria magnacalcarata]|uniref:Carboxymuconolactone decarboxylase-like domain-containing protein n=2 Tax=Rotaria magnacalcarata TaxID=392030 RepID=A0A816NVA1_9BILA|nr:unnamed protein product [Rotaria magnacalcarata]CAF2052775.1 unnamed protein product [Rotaria magnacalcarata]CAF2136211.1 unnamed protein product [Rotaria magnacalcarata]CAF4158669.1 unnamed protein product [Rotaria magnacalcarata]CAF4255606.1 unnamed protein product [Rotaria magnacalcarata]
MSLPLVSPLPSNANDKVAELATFFNETLGFCPNSVLTMQHRPAIATAFIQLNKAVMNNQGRVTSALKRLIGYVSSSKTGCQYCQAHTILAAERYGATTEQLAYICQYSTHPAFSAAERAALDFAVAASTAPNAVNSGIIENLRQHWDEGEIVEILGVIGLFGYLNRWNDSMGTSIEPGAINAGEAHLKKHGWSPGKHAYTKHSS